MWRKKCKAFESNEKQSKTKKYANEAKYMGLQSEEDVGGRHGQTKHFGQ
jgi:hypothetical protein